MAVRIRNGATDLPLRPNHRIGPSSGPGPSSGSLQSRLRPRHRTARAVRKRTPQPFFLRSAGLQDDFEIRDPRLVPPRAPTAERRPAPEQRLRSRSRYRYPPSHRPTAPQRSGRQGPGAAGWKEHARPTPARSRSCRHHTKNGHLYRWPLYVSRTRGRESDGENSGTRSSDEPKKGTFPSPKKRKKGATAYTGYPMKNRKKR